MLYPYNIRNTILYNTLYERNYCNTRLRLQRNFFFYNNILMWLQLVGAQVFANYRVEVHQMYGQSNVYLVLEYNQINVKL